MLTVEMLPAEHGDCLWVQYGDPGRPSVLLVDGGTGARPPPGVSASGWPTGSAPTTRPRWWS
jgi:hypothetical protein